MPVMDGYGAAKAIRALNRPDADLPIIAMTADAFSEDIQRCLECGMNAHIAKPIDINNLIRNTCFMLVGGRSFERGAGFLEKTDQVGGLLVA